MYWTICTKYRFLLELMYSKKIKKERLSDSITKPFALFRSKDTKRIL